jgi:hypothetical protein
MHKQRKRHGRKALYKRENLLYFLFQSPEIKMNKTRTKIVINPNEDSHRPERRQSSTRTKIVIDPNEVVFSFRLANYSENFIVPHAMTTVKLLPLPAFICPMGTVLPFPLRVQRTKILFLLLFQDFFNGQNCQNGQGQVIYFTGWSGCSVFQ